MASVKSSFDIKTWYAHDSHFQYISRGSSSSDIDSKER
jgi:hypothetical protein